jgi:hypothetical protein
MSLFFFRWNDLLIMFLTQADKREISKLRDSLQRQQTGQRASQSPEPEESI